MDKEPLPRDTSRFKKLTPDQRPVLPKGLSGKLDPISGKFIEDTGQLELFPNSADHEPYNVDLMIEQLRGSEFKK